MQVPDLAEQRGEPRVLPSPCHQHLRVGVVEGAQFRQAPDEAGEVLGVLGVVDFRVFVEDAQERLLQLFDVALVPQERAVCGAGRESAVSGQGAGTRGGRTGRGQGAAPGEGNARCDTLTGISLPVYLKKTQLLLQGGHIRSQ